MDISFNGIKNINLSTAKFTDYGAYLNRMDEINYGTRYNKIISLSADLDDSVIKGEDIYRHNFRPHIYHYLDALQKLKNFSKYQSIIGSDPKKVNIIMKRQSSPDNLGAVSQSLFFINGESVPLTSRNTLPLYTFMARFTRDILQFFKLPPEARKLIRLMNKSISEEAVGFIENMNL